MVKKRGEYPASTEGNGYCKEYNKRAVVIAEGLYVNNRKHGVWREYYDTGQLMIEENYHHGIKHGSFRAFYPSGQQASEGHFKFGWREGYFKVFDETGVAVKFLLFQSDVEVAVHTPTELNQDALSQEQRN